MLYKGVPLVNEIAQDFKYGTHPDVFKSHNGWLEVLKKLQRHYNEVFTRSIFLKIHVIDCQLTSLE